MPAKATPGQNTSSRQTRISRRRIKGPPSEGQVVRWMRRHLPAVLRIERAPRSSNASESAPRQPVVGKQRIVEAPGRKSKARKILKCSRQPAIGIGERKTARRKRLRVSRASSLRHTFVTRDGGLSLAVSSYVG